MTTRHLRLGEAISVKHGFAFPGELFSEEEKFPTLVTPGNFAIGGGFQTTRPKTFAGDIPAGYELDAGDLILTMTDLSRNVDTLGLPAVVPTGARYLHNQRIGKVLIKRPDLLRQDFLAYYLRTSVYRNHIVGTASGSTVRHTSPSRIEDFVATIPDVREQRAIAEVLGALDDKIVANTKISATALELAHTNFHRAVLSASFNGSTFADLATVGGGGTPSTKVSDYWDGTIPWATPTDVTGLAGPYLESTSRCITAEGLSSCASSLYRSGTILMTSRATIGAFAIAQVDTAVNQGFIAVQPLDPTLKYWLFHEMRDRVDEFISMANGATFLELGRGNFKKFEVRLADQQTMSEFARSAESLHAVAREALRQNQALSSTRDALLPQLMSGKLRVKDAATLVSDIV
ncbi:hypothetical protein SCMU_20470 [Sinomonas cyclohexanicum]|uniref:Type I restriction modification DNA specificity domain-containing protein n=1 Tax=Sinomonas cyclohexanicum TaxID=322009 RepID=A0ABN6FI10_SINCY|nr:restriction endonuclease subunit S [Corynebacterium cyclohexanicum]BCT76205.1 hypothetical protein SCMU_20470 [Corynebacterium cyclohexanicum]